MAIERPVILNLPPAPSNLTAPSPPHSYPSNWDEDDTDDAKTESGRSTSTFTASETGTETYSFSYASTNYGDIAARSNNNNNSPQLFAGQPSSLDASTLLALAKSSSPMLPLLQLEDGDTYIFLTPSSTSHNSSERVVRMRYTPPMRVPSARLLATKSAVFRQLLSERAQERIIKRLVKQKKLVPNRDGNPLPPGIKFAIDLTPDEEGEQAVEWIERLWCPEEVLEWQSMTEPLPAPRSPSVDKKTGQPDFMAMIREHEADQKKALKQLQDKWASKAKIDDSNAFGASNPVKEEEEDKDEGMGDESSSSNSANNSKSSSSKSDNEDVGEDLKVQNYSFARHLLNLERMIHIIHNLDPMITSTPDWYTLHCLSVYFGTTDATRDYTAKWIYANYPTIVEQHPMLVWKVAIEAGLVSIAADAWSSAVMGIGTSVPMNPESVPGALEGRKAFEERVEGTFEALFNDRDSSDIPMVDTSSNEHHGFWGGKWIEQYLPQCTDTRPDVVAVYNQFTDAIKDYIITRLTRNTNPPSGWNVSKKEKMDRLLNRAFWDSVRESKIWDENDHVSFAESLRFSGSASDNSKDINNLKRVNKTWRELEEHWNELEGEGEVDMMEMLMKDKSLGKSHPFVHNTQEEKEREKVQAEIKKENIAGPSMETLIDLGPPRTVIDDEDLSSVADMKGSEDGMDDWDDVTVDDKTTIGDDTRSVAEGSVVSDVSVIRRKIEKSDLIDDEGSPDKGKGKEVTNDSSTTLNTLTEVAEEMGSRPQPIEPKIRTERELDELKGLNYAVPPLQFGEGSSSTNERVPTPPIPSKPSAEDGTAEDRLFREVDPHKNNPAWLSTALVNLRYAYPNGDQFWGIQVPRGAPDLSSDGVPINPTFVSYHRIICKDCPEKMYFTGPGLSADNFYKHLSLPLHRQRVYMRQLEDQKRTIHVPQQVKTETFYNDPYHSTYAPAPTSMVWPKDLVHILNTCQYHITSVANSMLQVNVDFDLLLLENVLSCLDERERRFMPLWAGGEVNKAPPSANINNNGEGPSRDKGKRKAADTGFDTPSNVASHRFLGGNAAAAAGAAFPSAVSMYSNSVIGEVSTINGASSVATSVATTESGVMIDTPDASDVESIVSGQSSGFEDIGDREEQERLIQDDSNMVANVEDEEEEEEDDDFDLMDEASDEAFGL